MAGVRNGPLVRGVLNTVGTHFVATVPFNFTWLIKTVHLNNLSGATADVRVAIASPGGEVVVTPFAADVQPGTTTSFFEETGAVSGDVLELVTNQVPVHFWVFGAGLPGMQAPISYPTVTELPSDVSP